MKRRFVRWLMKDYRYSCPEIQAEVRRMADTRKWPVTDHAKVEDDQGASAS